MDDMIDRQAVLDKFEPWLKVKDYNDGELNMLKAILYEIRFMPSVTPKQRTGKWIKLDMHRGMADHKCTACGQECYVPTCMGEPMYAFCPNCGAKMEGADDE